MKNILNRFLTYLKDNYKSILINIIVISFCIFASCYNFPYLVYKPGGMIPLESRITIEGEDITLGDYNMAYVAVSRGNLINLLLANVFSNWDLVKENAMIIPNSDYETTLKVEKIDMQNAINTAKYVAFKKAGMNANLNQNSNMIYLIDDNANTDLQVLDEILLVDNKDFNLEEMKDYFNTLEVGSKITFRVKNNNKEYDRYAYLYEVDGQKIVGIYLYNIIDVETDPKIEIKAKNSEAGSSGGMMMTLAIYDALTDGDLTKGKKIVGTGTMDLEGKVGSIGGVKYKLLGAKKDKADIFLIARDNYEEAKEIYDKYKLKFELVCVDTFDDVIAFLNSK